MTFFPCTNIEHTYTKFAPQSKPDRIFSMFTAWTHHIRLVHLDGHFSDGVCCLVDHFKEAGPAQRLGADRSGQLKTHVTILSRPRGKNKGESFWQKGDESKHAMMKTSCDVESLQSLKRVAHFLFLQKLSDIWLLQKHWVSNYPLEIPVKTTRIIFLFCKINLKA